MRFGFFLRVPWWLMLLALAAELAVWIIVLPFWGAWKLYDMRLARRDEVAIAAGHGDRRPFGP